jgi:hypothetical protein
LEIEGLTHEQGNRQIAIETESKGAGGSLRSEWRRHAALTVYVPRCKSVALRGCQVALDVDGVETDLVVSSEGSRNRDYDGWFEIKRLKGSISVLNVPIRRIQECSGNVSIVDTEGFDNNGQRHENGQVELYTPPPQPCVCRDIDGDLTLWFCRAALDLQNVSGKVDVQNEFGDTRWTIVKRPAEQPHRIVSESGRVVVHAAADALKEFPLLAMSQCGTVRVVAPFDRSDNASMTMQMGPDLGRRSWIGIWTKRSPTDFDRLRRILEGQPRSTGLDLISLGGTVVLAPPQ